MLKLIAATVATFTGSFALACSLPDPVTVYQIEVTTYDGNLYVAGSGDDCRAAWQGADIPAGWMQIICVPVSR